MADKVAIITAGGSGMGAGAARKLAEDGFQVGILSSSGKGEALAEELNGVGCNGLEPVAGRPQTVSRRGHGAVGSG